MKLYSSGMAYGQRHYECNLCPFDTFSTEKMREHFRFNHPDFKAKEELVLEQFLGSKDSMVNPGKVALCALFWEHEGTMLDSMHALHLEAKRYKALGMEARIIILDNGSIAALQWDARQFKQYCADDGVECELILFPENRGISKARNALVDSAKKDCQFILFTDGDIEVVPYSSLVMAQYLVANPKVGCIGPYSQSFSDSRELIDTELFEIIPENIRTTPHIAWTQYGVFRIAMFDSIRFEVNGPFGGPGWGLEDDDLVLQMANRGYETHNFRGLIYLHRDIRSSIKTLYASGLDAKVLFNERLQFVKDKWRGQTHPFDTLHFSPFDTAHLYTGLVREHGG